MSNGNLEILVKGSPSSTSFVPCIQKDGTSNHHFHYIFITWWIKLFEIVTSLISFENDRWSSSLSNSCDLTGRSSYSSYKGVLHEVLTRPLLPNLTTIGCLYLLPWKFTLEASLFSAGSFTSRSFCLLFIILSQVFNTYKLLLFREKANNRLYFILIGFTL